MTDEQEMELYEELKLVYAENERLREALEFIASPDGSCYNCASIALAALEGK
jgi:cell shape-determining protein MreC